MVDDLYFLNCVSNPPRSLSFTDCLVSLIREVSNDDEDTDQEAFVGVVLKHLIPPALAWATHRRKTKLLYSEPNGTFQILLDLTLYMLPYLYLATARYS